jgi:hypothetical protein
LWRGEEKRREGRKETNDTKSGSPERPVFFSTIIYSEGL